jgi:hypothetical protein
MTDLPKRKRDAWDCPQCPWTGVNASIDVRRWEVLCPECNAVINDKIARLMEDTSDWSREYNTVDYDDE